MNYISIILALLGVAVAAGAVTAWFKRSAGKERLQTNINAYKDSEKLKDQRIAYLEGQLVIKDETIKRLVNK
jgi:hypothetical protein